MMKSMTGFGRGEFSSDSLKFTVEMKSVNHRYLDANIRIPKEYAYLDTSIRSELKRYLGRGKVDVFVTYEILGEAEYDLQSDQCSDTSQIRCIFFGQPVFRKARQEPEVDDGCHPDMAGFR